MLITGAIVSAYLAASAAVVEVSPEHRDVHLGAAAAYLIDTTGTLDVTDALARMERASHPVGGTMRGFGPQSGAVWLRVDVVSPTDRAWELVYDAPLVERLEFHIEGPQRHDTLLGGLAVPESRRTIVNHGAYHSARVHFGAGEQATILVRAQVHGPLYAGLYVALPEVLADRDLHTTIMLAIGAGVAIVVFLLSLFAWWTTRARSSLHFAGIFVAFSFYELSTLGIGPAFLWPGSPNLSLWLPSASSNVCNVMTLLYARSFLALRERWPRIDRLMQILLWPALAAAVLAPVGPVATLVVAAVMSPITCTAVATATVRAVLRGDRPARYLLVAVGVAAVCGAGIALADLGIIPANGFTLYSVYYGAWVGALVLLLGLVDRVELGGRERRAALEVLVRDRTAELHTTVEQLRENEELFRTVFNAIPDATAMVRASTGQILAISPSFESTFGWTSAEVIGRTSTELGLYERVEDRDRFLRADGVSRVVEADVRMRRKNGSSADIQTTVSHLTLRGEDYLVGFLRDVTERRRAEREQARLMDDLRQAQKMEAVGQLAGGVAHDFNNLLQVISANASIARQDAGPDSIVTPQIEEIEAAADRATALTRQLLAFGRRQVISPRPVDLSVQVDGLRNMLCRLIGENLGATFQLAPFGLRVMVDPIQLEQIVINLVVNARDAIGAHGRIAVSTWEAELAEGPPGRFGVVQVTDNGQGMTPEVQARIFEPFFTTKRAGKGTGLGLSTVHGIAAQHGGFVRVSSEPGHGTAFTVYLPRAAEAAAPARGTNEGRRAPDGVGRVLIVEDEEGVRAIGCAMLERAGYKVSTASDGVEALEALQRERDQIAVVLTDLVLPRMSGRELRARVRLMGLHVPFVFMSGYSRDTAPQDDLFEDDIILVEKPFSLSHLTSAIEDALRGEPAEPEQRLKAS